LSLLNLEPIHSFRTRILSLSGEDASRCTQCGKCTAGCPISAEMDLQPNQVLRWIQINDSRAVLSSSTIWLCASCRTCSVRCPEEIEIAKVMDVLRKLALEEKFPLREKPIVRFNEIFLEMIKKRGRVHEVELMARYNLAVGRPLKDAHLGLAMLARGKLGLLGQKVKELSRVREIFRQSKRFFQSGG
jgi:heterodisulfide reductase subunit C2